MGGQGTLRVEAEWERVGRQRDRGVNKVSTACWPKLNNVALPQRGVAWTITRLPTLWPTGGALQRKLAPEPTLREETRLVHGQMAPVAKYKHVGPHEHHHQLSAPLPAAFQAVDTFTTIFHLFPLIQPLILELGSQQLSSEWSERGLGSPEAFHWHFQWGLKLLI